MLELIQHVASCRGDAMLRSNYSSKLKQLMQQASVMSDIHSVVDLGCSTGLSTLELHAAFPEAHITALDLSPYFIAVANHEQQQRQVCAEPVCQKSFSPVLRCMAGHLAALVIMY